MISEIKWSVKNIRKIMDFDFDTTLLELISSIISLRQVNPIVELSKEPGFSNLIANTILPTYSLIELHQRKDFIRRCKDANQYFTTYPLSFTFCEEGLKFLQENQKLISEKLIPYYNQYIIYNFLSWINNYLIDSKEEYLIELMDSLLLFKYDLNIQCFFILYYICIKTNPINLFQSVLPLLNNVFLTKFHDQLPSYAYSFLPLHFSLLFKNDETEQNNEIINFTPDAEQMMHFLSLVLVDQSSNITNEIALQLFQPIESTIVKRFELNSMRFFSNLAPFLSFDTKNETISLFPKNICEHIENNSEMLFVLPSTKHEIKSYKFVSVIGSNFSFSDTIIPISLFFTQTNPEIRDIDTYLDYTQKIVHFPNVSFNSICDDLLVSYLSLISKSIGDNDDLLRNFISTFSVLIDERKVDKYSLSIMSAFLVFCQFNDKAKHIIDITQIILKNEVWTPAYSIFFNSEKDFSGINSLRQFSLDFILEQDPSNADLFLQSSNLNPIIVAEICERLLQPHNFSLFLKTPDHKRLLRSICAASFAFIQKTENAYDSDIDLGQLSVLRLLSRLLKEKEDREIFFDDAIFLSFFFGLLFEEPLQNYVLNEIKLFLINDCENEINENFTQSFYHLFEQIMRLFPNSDKSQVLATKILKTFFAVFDVKPFFSVQFSFVLRLFCDAIEEESSLSQNSSEEILKRLELLFKFFEYIDKRDLSMDIILLLYNLIVTKKLVECNDQLFEMIKKPMIENNIIIQPYLAKLMMFCFWQISKSKIIELFTELCQLTSLNAIGLHDAEIDLYLVDELRNKELNDQEIDERLNLLEMISIVVSSPIVVQNYISLLKGNTKYLNFLNKLIILNYSIPISILPLDVVIEKEFQIEHLGTFSAIAWLFIDSDKNSMTIFRLNDDEILVKIDKTQLFVNDSYIFDIPLKKWFFIALTFSFEQESVIGYLNTTLIKSVPVDSIEWSILNLRKYKMGDSNSLTGRYGNFGFIKNLAKINVRYFVEAGPRNIAEPKVSTIEYFTPRRISDVRATFLRSADIVNFVEVFLQICKIELILPLFAQLTDDNERLTQIFSVLRNSLLIDESQQSYFSEIDGFAIISHLLALSSFKGLTFDFYMKFYTLCQEIGYEKLRNSLIKDVLINFELWTRSSEFLAITDHWKNVLFAGFDFISLELMSFHELLSKLRIYLFYQPVEEKFIRNDLIAFPKNQIAEIRANIIEILLNQYSHNLTMFDLALLMSHCISCEDVQQIHDLLLFYSQLANNNISNELRQFWTKTESLISLIHLLSSTDSLLVTTTLSIIRNFQRENLVPDFSFPEIMLIFFQQLKYRNISIDLIQKLIMSIQTDMPELFPVCCYFALMETEKQMIHMKMDKEKNVFTDIFETLTPSEELSNASPFWALWAVYGAILLDNSSVFSFLISCSNHHWVYLFCLIDRVCSVFNFNGDFWKQRFVNLLTEHVQKSKNESDICVYANLVSFFIFYRKNKRYNAAVLHLFKEYDNENQYAPPPINILENSQTSISNAWHVLIEKTSWVINSTDELNRNRMDAEEKLLDSAFYNDLYYFGLRLSEDGKWLDEELAKQVVDILALSPQYQPYFKLLSHFLNRSQEPVSQADVDAVLDKNLIIGTYELFTKLREIAKINLYKATKLFSYQLNPLINYGNNNLEQEKQKIISRIEKSTKNWRFLWSHMTIDHAPWASSLKSNARHYRRDFSSGAFWCPFKMKINRHFDIHKLASEMRDSGNFVEEKPKIENKSIYPLSILEEELIPSNKETLIVDDNDFIFKHECEVIKINKIKKNQTFSINAKYFKVENKVYKMDDIKMVFWRRRKQYPTAIEIYFINGNTLFLNFPGLKNRAVADKIAAFVPSHAVLIQQSDYDMFFQQTKLTEKWRRRKISNFEYLMSLNIFGGRSFNDPSQYPFLPWILTDYRSPTLDLNNSESFRDLSKPVGALGKERLSELVQRLADLKYFGLKEFLYSCFVSTPLSVFLFLMRVEPYTTQHISLQGGRFDTPLRQFFSIPRLFDSVITQMNDYRELTPEFFFDIEFLMNKNDFDLGYVNVDPINNEPTLQRINEDEDLSQLEKDAQKQFENSNTENSINEQNANQTNETNQNENGGDNTGCNGLKGNSPAKPNSKSISNVELPPWANSKPINFIYMNRKALESEYVSNNLNNWIDLIFGVKQRGEEAVKNFNTYNEDMYDDIWEKNQDCNETRRSEIETTIEQVGQIPPQLFKAKHPQRFNVVTKSEFEAKNENERQNLQIKRIPILSRTMFREMKVGVLFSTIHLMNKSIIQLKMITTSYEIRTIDVEFVRILPPPEDDDPETASLLVDGLKRPPKAQERIEINTHVLSSIPLQSLQENEDATSFAEIDRNIVLFVANNFLDAFVVNLDTQHTYRINERRQKITSVASARPETYKKRFKLDMFSISLDDSRTNIYKEIESSLRQRENSSFGFNLGFGFNLSSSNLAAQSRDNQNLNVIERPTMERTLSSQSIRARTPSSSLIEKPENKKGSKKLTSIFSSIIGSLTGDELPNYQSMFGGSPPSTRHPYQSIFQKNRSYELKFSVPTYRKAILCSAISLTFNVSISGADDGSLIVASISDGSTIRVIQLKDNRIPVYVLVTPGWGFILVNSQKYVNGRQKFFMSLYTINGDEIQTIPVDFQIERGIQWTSDDGFDYVALLTKNDNKIYAFEAFYLDKLSKKNLLFNSYQKIVAFEFIKSLSIICAITVNGCLMVIPISIDAL